ncbi:MAG TPA: ABC transporter ATP-binding protein [Opitutaceae bacterium]|nr:ABC transporter ATP-binding protein [Opitutaceae bacterium]
MSFFEIRSASKSFRTASGTTCVLRDINLSVARGEFVAIVGYSGSGKTTLINLLAGLVRPDGGSVTLDGKPVTGPGPDRGMVFQNYSLLPWLTVTQNVALAVDQCFPAWDAERRRAHVERHIAMVNLTPHAAKLPRQLSGGQRQRVAVARGLAMDPQVLLLDEPLGALDALTRGTLQEEIVRIWEGDKKTVVLITNDVDEALLMADRIIPLTTGPGATLDAPVPVTLERPRVRKDLNHDPEFKRLRALVTQRLLGFGARRQTTQTRRLALPNVLPEDLTRGRPLLAWGMRARRRDEVREVPVTSVAG